MESDIVGSMNEVHTISDCFFLSSICELGGLP